MKNTLFCALMMATLLLGSCRENTGCTDPAAINYDIFAEVDDGSCTAPSVALTFVPKIDSSRLGFGITYQINDLDVRFDQIRFYATEIDLATSEGNVQANTALLATENSEATNIGEVPVSELESIAFNVGVDSVSNHADPALFDADSPLSADNPNIQHWNWTAGYIFLIIEGAVDVNGDGIFDQMNEAMSLHAGFDSNLKRIILPVSNKTLNQVNYGLNVELNVKDIFENYDLANQLFSRPSANPEYAAEIMNNIQNAFSVE